MIRAALKLWVIADIMRSFPGLDFLPAKLYLFVGITGATMAISCALYCFHGHGKLTMQTKDMAILLNQCVNIAWATFSVSILGAIKLLNFGWDPQGAGIACGVFLRICSNLVVGEMFASHAKPIRLTGNVLDTLCSIAFFLLWSYLIVRPPIPHSDREQLGSPHVHRSVLALLVFSGCRERWKTTQ